MSGVNIKSLAREAMLRSINVRNEHGLDLVAPLDVYALCKRMGVKVRFVDITSMEGMYGRGEAGTVIWLSSLRPLPRRNFTCAHELGHHAFGHGSTVDEFLEDAAAAGGGRARKAFDPNEFLADTFAGFLMMPTLGMRSAFAARGWDAKTATPAEVFTVACHFGVGYETLVGHLTHALRTISTDRATELKRVGPKEVREEILGAPVSDPLIIADEQWVMPTVDAEVGTLLLLPSSVTAENDLIISAQADLSGRGRLFRAVRPGMVRVAKAGADWAVFVRVSRFQFAGFAEYRHLEREDDDDE